jgi:hypothetical protein
MDPPVLRITSLIRAVRSYMKMRGIIRSQVPNDLSEKIAFGMLEVDPEAHREICVRHYIRNIPFFAFYRDGALTRTCMHAHAGGINSVFGRVGQWDAFQSGGVTPSRCWTK